MKLIRFLFSNILLIAFFCAVIYTYYYWDNLTGKDTPAGRAVAYLSDEFDGVGEFVEGIKQKQNSDSNSIEKNIDVMAKVDSENVDSSEIHSSISTNKTEANAKAQPDALVGVHDSARASSQAGTQTVSPASTQASSRTAAPASTQASSQTAAAASAPVSSQPASLANAPTSSQTTAPTRPQASSQPVAPASTQDRAQAVARASTPGSSQIAALANTPASSQTTSLASSQTTAAASAQASSQPVAPSSAAASSQTAAAAKTQAGLQPTALANTQASSSSQEQAQSSNLSNSAKVKDVYVTPEIEQSLNRALDPSRHDMPVGRSLESDLDRAVSTAAADSKTDANTSARSKSDSAAVATSNTSVSMTDSAAPLATTGAGSSVSKITANQAQEGGSELDKDLSASSEESNKLIWIAAREAFYRRDYVASVNNYTQLINNTTDNFDAYGELGNVYFNQGKKPEAAAAYYEAAAILVKQGQANRANSLIPLLNYLDDKKAKQLRALINPG